MPQVQFLGQNTAVKWKKGLNPSQIQLCTVLPSTLKLHVTLLATLTNTDLTLLWMWIALSHSSTHRACGPDKEGPQRGLESEQFAVRKLMRPSEGCGHISHLIYHSFLLLVMRTFICHLLICSKGYEPSCDSTSVDMLLSRSKPAVSQGIKKHAKNECIWISGTGVHMF